MKNVAQFSIGVDLHQKVLQFCVVDCRGDVVHEAKVAIPFFPSSDTVFEVFQPWRSGCHIAVEAVGMNRWFVNGLLARGYDIVVCDPVKLNLKILGKKTDKRDAREIARRLWLGDIDRDAKTFYPDDQTYGDRKLERTRQDLMKLRVQLVNQIKAMLRAYNLAPPAKTLHSQSGIKRLLAMEMVNESLTQCLHHSTRSLAAVTEAIAGIKAAIAKRASKDPSMQLMVAHLPSMGAISALGIVSELGEVARFRNAKAVASSAGLVPRVNQSADRSHHGRLTKRGNRGLRFLLCQWAVRLMATHPLVKAWSERERKRLHVNKVRMALARKLLIGVWVMLSRGEVFDLRRCLAI